MTDSQQAAGRDEVEVAHEALIRHWPRLRQWLDQDRAALLLRESIREAAQEWARHDRDESYLAHRGRRLVDAEALAQHPRFTLNAQEQAYLDAAVALREREEREREAQRQRELTAERERAELAEAARHEAEQRVAEQAVAARGLRQRFMIAVGLGALALLAAIGAFWGFQQAGVQRDRAEEQSVAAEAARVEAEAARLTAVAERQIAQVASTRAVAGEATAEAEQQRARSRELAARAVERAEEKLDLGLLIAREALASGNTLEAQSSLLAALAAKPGLIAFLHGHQGTVKSIAVSPDGALLATGSTDQTIRLWDLSSRRPRGEPLIGHSMGATSLAFSPDGKTLASGGCQRWSGQQGCVRGELFLWDVERGRPLSSAIAEHTSDIVALAFSPDGRLVASGGCGGWTAELSPCAKGEVRLLDVANRAASSDQLTGHTEEVTSLAFAPDGRSLASAALDGTIVLWDVASRQSRGSPIKARGAAALHTVVFSPDGASLIAASWGRDDPIVRISEWTVATGSSARPPVSVDRGENINALVFSPDRRTLAEASGCGQVGGALDCTKTGLVKLWDVASGEPVGSPLTGHSLGVASLAFGRDGQRLVTGGFDSKVIIWDPDQGPAVSERLVDGDDLVMGLAISPDGAMLAVGSWDQTIGLWDVATRQLRQTLSGQTSFVFDAAFSPDGTMLASVGGCGRGDGSGGTCIPDARLWNLTTGESRELPLPTPRLKQWSVAFSSNGRVLASAGCGVAADGTRCTRGEVRLWDPATGQLIGEPLVQDYDSVFAVAFSPDGKLLASGGCGAPVPTNYGCPRGVVLLWDLQTRQVVGRLEGHNDVRALAFDPSGHLLASASSDETIILWDVATGQPLGPPLDGHTAGVSAITFSPDGRTLASSGSDQTVVLWDVAGRQPIGPPLIAHDGGVYDLAFAPDGHWLASGGGDGNVVLWNVDQFAWPDLACLRANRNLSQTEWEIFFPGERYRTTCSNLPSGDGAPGSPPPAATPT